MRTEEELNIDSALDLDRSGRTSLVEIKEFIDCHYNEALTIGQLAGMANICPKYFVDLFKKTFGQTTIDYLTHVRMNHAKRYLAESDDRLRDIAQRVGYKDEFYFSRIFKKKVGISPSEYARNSRQLIAACSSSIIGQLVALNVIPAAAPLDAKWTPFYYNAYNSEIKSRLKLTNPYPDSRFEENIEQLFRAKPDAIIGMDHLGQEEIAKLEPIAPTLIVPSHAGWRKQLETIATFLNKEEQAHSWIEQYERKVVHARSRMQQVVGNERVAALRIYGQSLYIYGNRGLEEVLYQDLQLQEACGLDTMRNQQITLDDLLQINPDRILIAVCPEATSRRYWLALLHSAKWHTLRAVARGSVYMISSDPWFEYSALAVTRMLDEALLLFTGDSPNGVLDKSHGESFAT
ncbi:HTH-type transcriptional activator Btr [Paenibacillus sp. GM2FR]|uniref:helix-turn-helix domain-containing protein n=1 Tax=unclassified Paenibacillus TaxID=185978 RepID=UPI000C278080|nr:helix-turn-helix domain-containing protein [Paenibacillus sp. GM2FR]PJN56546.1 HTH-type transcriptional activator Btr [Paenibacillus sp. GM2FR]